MRTVLDTSVLLGDSLPDGDVAVASVCWAELEFGVRAASTPAVGAARRIRLDRLRRVFGEGLPFDDDAAGTYGLLAGLVRERGRDPRRRALDLMIAATAVVNDAAIATRNADDLRGIEDVVDVVDLSA